MALAAYHIALRRAVRCDTLVIQSFWCRLYESRLLAYRRRHWSCLRVLILDHQIICRSLLLVLLIKVLVTHLTLWLFQLFCPLGGRRRHLTASLIIRSSMVVIGLMFRVAQRVKIVIRITIYCRSSTVIRALILAARAFTNAVQAFPTAILVKWHHDLLLLLQISLWVLRSHCLLLLLLNKWLPIIICGWGRWRLHGWIRGVVNHCCWQVFRATVEPLMLLFVLAALAFRGVND